MTKQEFDEWQQKVARAFNDGISYERAKKKGNEPKFKVGDNTTRGRIDCIMTRTLYHIPYSEKLPENAVALEWWAEDELEKV